MKPTDVPELTSVIAVMDVLSCGTLLMNRAGDILYANPRLAAMVGRPATELIGTNVRALPQADPGRATVDAALEAFEHTAEMQLQFERPDGSTMSVIVSGAPAGPVAPLADYRLATVIDISATKVAEQRAQEQLAVVTRLSDTVIDQALALKTYSATLEERVRARTRELHEANMDAIFMLAVACEAKDLDTGAHVLRIQQASEAIALELGLDAPAAAEIGHSAILHDIGKMMVPDHILQKPARLTAEERAIMEEHTLAGERILSTKAFFHVARQITRSHHENWDGSGYPDQTAGETIPLPARIVHVADVFDALSNPRVYKPAWPMDKTLAFLQEQAGRMFDREVVTAFRSVLARTAGAG